MRHVRKNGSPSANCRGSGERASIFRVRIRFRPLARPTTDRLPRREWSGVTTLPLNLSLPQSVLPAENYAPRGRASEAQSSRRA